MESMSRGSCQGVLLMLTVSEMWRGIIRKARRQGTSIHCFLGHLGVSSQIFQQRGWFLL